MSTPMGPIMRGVLEALERNPGMNFREIGQVVGLNRKKVSTRITTGLTRGLVEAQDNTLPWHKRLWQLTEAGQARLVADRAMDAPVHSIDSPDGPKVTNKSS